MANAMGPTKAEATQLRMASKARFTRGGRAINDPSGTLQLLAAKSKPGEARRVLLVLLWSEWRQKSIIKPEDEADFVAHGFSKAHCG